MLHNSSLCRAIVAAAVLPSFVAAQGAQNPQPLVIATSTTDDILLDTSGPNAVAGPYEGFQVVELTGDYDPDAILVANGSLHAVVGLGSMAASEKLGSQVSSAVAIPPLVGHGCGAILAAVPNGILKVQFDAATQSFGAPLMLASGAGWGGIDLMRQAQVDNLGFNDLILVPSNAPQAVEGWKITTANTLEPLFAFGIGEDVVDVAAVDWTGDGLAEVAVLGTSTLTVRNTAGTVLASWAVPGPGGVLGRLRGTDAQPGDRLLWARRNAADSLHELLVLTAAQLAPTPLPLRFRLDPGGAEIAVDVAGISSGDCDGDGDVDLLISHTTFQASAILGNLGTTQPLFTTEPSGYRLMQYASPASAPAPGASAPAAFADVDGDGDYEGFVPYPDSDGIAYVPRTPVFTVYGSEPQQLTAASTVVAEAAYYGLDDEVVNAPHLVGPFKLHVTIPAGIDISLYDHVHVQAWEQDSPSAAASSIGLLNQLIPLPVPQAGDQPDQLGFHIDWGEPAYFSWPSGRHVYFNLRLVDLASGTTNVFLRTTGWWVAGYTGDPDYNDTSEAYKDYLRNSPFYLDDRDTSPFDPSPGGGIPGGIVLGMTADLGRIGVFNGVPMPPPIEVYPTSTLPGAFFWDY